MRRAWKRVGVVTAAVVGLGLAVPPGAVPAQGSFPLAGLASWLAPSTALGAVTGLPLQKRGPDAVDTEPASAAETRARGGAGRKPAPVPDTLAPYEPHDPTVPRRLSSDVEGEFDERTSKRLAERSSARSDVFRNADGSETTRTYSRPVNYRAADGTWRKIDPNLVRRNGRLHVKANSVGISVAAETVPPTAGRAAPETDGSIADTEELANLTLPTGESLSFWLDGAQPVAGEVDGSRATYRGILPHTDLELETFDAGVKETLILRSPEAAATWVFPLRLDGLTPGLSADGSVELRNDDGKAVAWLPRGWMADANVDPQSGSPAESTDVRYELLEQDGGWALKVEADQAWLRDPARVYPVRVDPTATTVTTGDVFVDNDRNTSGNGDNLPVGTYNSGTTKARSFIHLDEFDDDGFKGKRITAAKLKLYLTWAWSCTEHLPFWVHRVAEKWTVADLTNGTYPGPDLTSPSIGTLDPSSLSPACTNDAADRSVGKWITVPLNAATFNDWSTGAPNYGLGLVASVTNSRGWKRFTSANYASGKYKPVLELTYANNVAPQINARYPANNAVSPTLTPELLVRGHDSDNWPAKGLKYTFVVYDTAGKPVVNSGAQNSPAWTVPAGKLNWNTTYLWQAQVGDTISLSPGTPLWAFNTSVPQPALTSGLAQNPGKGYDASIGNYTTSATDASVATVGPSLAVTRSYNSLDNRRTHAFGTGWSSILDARATQVTDAAGGVQTVTVTYPSGQDQSFGRKPDGTFTPPPARFATLKETRSGSTVTGYTLTDKDATSYTFGRAAGGGVFRLTAVTDANNRALTVTYDADGNATRLTGASGRSLGLKWSTPTGSTGPHVSEIYTDPVEAGDWNTSQVWQYTYGPDDRLEKVCPPTTWEHCWTYGYDQTSQYANTVLNTGPTSYWPLSETSGSTAASAVLSNAGTDHARYVDVALGRPAGLAGSGATAAGFNGTGSYLQLPGKLIADGQYQSVSMWFRTSTPNGVLFSYNGDPLSKGTSTRDYTPALYIDKNGMLRGQFWTGTAKPINSNVKVTDGAWHHVVLAGAGDSQTLYVDGVARGTLAGTIATYTANSGNNVNVGGGFFGAGWPDHPNSGKSPGVATYFTGDISDVAFFNQTLTKDTVSTLRAAGTMAQPVLNKVTRPSGGVTASVGYDRVTGKVAAVTDENGGTWTLSPPTVAGSSAVYAAAVLGAKPTDYYRLAEVDAGDTVNEVAGGTATYHDVTLGAAGPFADATAASFDGTSSYLTMPPGAVAGVNPASIEMWFKMPSGNTAGGVLYGYQNTEITDTEATGGWVPALYVGKDGKLRGGFWTNSTSPITSSGKVNDGKWHHVALSAGTGTQSLYLDGALVGKRDANLADFGAAHAYVGAGRWSGAWPEAKSPAVGYFPGSIAEVAYYPSALTAEQVASHITASKQTAPVAVTMVSGVAKAVPMPVSQVAVTGPSGERLVSSYDVVNGNRIVAQSDALGNVTKFGYDVGGFSSLVYDPRGVWTQNLQDVRGNTKQTITCQDQAAGRCSSVYYTYYPDATTTALTPDARNDLLLSVRDGRSASATDDTYLTTFGYDARGNRTTVTDPLGRVTRTVFTDGTTPAVGGGVVPAGLPTTVTTPGRARQTVKYNAAGDIVELIDPVGKIVRYGYDGLGQLRTETEVTDTFPQGRVTEYSYDGLGRQRTIKEPAVTNRVTGAVHTRFTTLVYDVDGNVLERKEEDLTGGDAPRIERHVYDEHGREVSSTTPGDSTSEYGYDVYGRIVEEVDDDGGRTRNAYDLEGNLLTTTLVGWTGHPDSPEPPRDLVVSAMSYDPAGRLASETDAMGWTTSYTYTDNGLEAKTVRSDGESSFVVEENSYDAAGNVIRTVTNNGATVTTIEYDAAGRPVKERVDPDDLDRMTRLTYDADDNVVHTEQLDGSGEDDGWTLVSESDMLYDADGNVLQETVSYGYDPVARWKLADISGDRAADSGGNSAGRLTGGVRFATERDGSADFDGTGSIETTAPAVDTTRDYTVAAWVKLTDKGADRTVVSQDGERTSGFAVQYLAGQDRWAVTVPDTDSDSATARRAVSTSVPQLDAWTHLAAAHDEDDGVVRFYVNDKLEATVAAPAPVPSRRGFAIGRALDEGAPAARWHGAIKDVQVYQRTGFDFADIMAGEPDYDDPVVRTSYQRDADGQVVAGTDPNGNTTYYGYDEAGNLAKVTAPAATAETATGGAVLANAVSWHGYNTFDELTDSKDENGNWTVTAYDADGQVVSTRMPSYTAPGETDAVTPELINRYDVSGRLTHVRDPLGHTTRYEYDQMDRLTKVIAANGGETRYRYDLVGDLLETVDPNGAVQAATWDYLGRRLTSTDAVRQTGKQHTTTYRYGFGGWLSEVESPGKVITKTEYNAVGEPVVETDGANNQTRYEYGPGWTRTTLPDGSSTLEELDFAGRVTEVAETAADDTVYRYTFTEYDPAGNVTATVDAKGTRTRFEYDATGMLVRQRQPISGSDEIVTSFGYDLAGNQTRFTDGRGNAFWTTYNSWGLPESQIEPATAAHPDPADRTFTISYDSAGRPVRQVLPGGVTLTSRYDEMGRLIEQAGQGAEAATENREFDYDTGGRLTAFSGVGGSNRIAYDDRNLPTAITGPSGDTRFDYTADGALAERQDAAGTTRFGYDPAGRLKSLTNESAGVAQSITYNRLSQITKIQYGTGNARNFGFDGFHRLTSDELTTASGDPVATIKYGWDDNDNLVSKTTTGFAGSAENTYTYDRADRLTSWNNGNTITEYAYDKSGNRVQNGDRLFEYDARNRLLAADGAAYTYTPRGTLATAGGQSTQTDAFGQVISQQAGGGTQTYRYDALGRLIRDGFAYSGLQNDLAADGTAGYVRGAAGEAVAMSAGGVSRLYWTDLHDDVVGQFAPDSTALTGSVSYDPLGEVLTTASLLGNLGYQSEWTDATTNRVNMHARWYNVATGQFDTRDTMSVSPVPDSVRANRYQYGDANPLTVTDPTGHFGWKSLVNKTKSIASSAWNGAKSTVSSAYNYASYHVSRAYTAGKNTVKAAAKQVKKTVSKAKKAVAKQFNKAKKYVKKKVTKAKKWVAKKAAKVKKAVKKVVKTVKQAGKKVLAKTTRAVKKAASAVKDAASATKKWVVEHKDTILEVAAIGGAILAGIACTAVTAGAGAIACMVGAGALINLAKDAAQGDINSFGDALGSMGTGALAGLAGGAGGMVASRIGVAVTSRVGTGIGGRLVSQAAENGVEDVFGQAVTTGRVDVKSAVLGMVPGAGLMTRKSKGVSGSPAGPVGARAPGRPAGGGGGCLPGRKHSFAPDTRVLMADGSARPIEDVNVGDEVAARDPETGEAGPRAVTQLHRNLDVELADVVVRDVEDGSVSRLETTQNHPFWNVTDRRWSEAGELEPGDELEVPGAGRAVVESVREFDGGREMRDLTVADIHTYYVLAGTTPVLVHNCGEAIVHLDPDAKHALITVRNGDEVLHTEQFGGVNTPTNGVGEFDPATLSPNTINVRIPLPNPGGAMAFAEVMMARTARGQYPDYNLATQSCVTYCAQVLRAGGVSDIPTRTKAATDWLIRKHG